MGIGCQWRDDHAGQIGITEKMKILAGLLASIFLTVLHRNCHIIKGRSLTSYMTEAWERKMITNHRHLISGSHVKQLQTCLRRNFRIAVEGKLLLGF